MARRSEKRHDVWTVADAKARLSEVIERAKGEPQVITRNGKPSAIVVSVEEWARETARKGTLAEFLLNSPLRGAELDLERLGDGPRDLLDFEVRARYQRPVRNAAARARSAGSRMARPARQGSRLHQRGGAGGDPHGVALMQYGRRRDALAHWLAGDLIDRFAGRNPARRRKDRFRLGRSDGGGQTTRTGSRFDGRPLGRDRDRPWSDAGHEKRSGVPRPRGRASRSVDALISCDHPAGALVDPFRSARRERRAPLPQDVVARDDPARPLWHGEAAPTAGGRRGELRRGGGGGANSCGCKAVRSRNFGKRGGYESALAGSLPRPLKRRHPGDGPDLTFSLFGMANETPRPKCLGPPKFHSISIRCAP